MYTFLSVLLFIVSALLVLFVAIQSSKGEGLGALGGGATLFSVKNRGWEATLDKITAILAIAFLVLALLVTVVEKTA